VVGCKCDALDDERKIKKEEGFKFMKTNLFQKTSYKQFQNLQFFFEVSSTCKRVF
jgi:hypothetical protein